MRQHWRHGVTVGVLLCLLLWLLLGSPALPQLGSVHSEPVLLSVAVVGLLIIWMSGGL